MDFIRKISLGGNFGVSASSYVGDLDDIWTDDIDKNVLRRGDGETPGGIIIGASGVQSIQGLQGPQGEQGIQGPIGPAGDGSDLDLSGYASETFVDSAITNFQTGIVNPLHDANNVFITQVESQHGARLNTLEAGMNAVEAVNIVQDTVAAANLARIEQLENNPGTVDLSDYATLANLAEEINKMSRPMFLIKAERHYLDGNWQTSDLQVHLDAETKYIRIYHDGRNEHKKLFWKIDVPVTINYVAGDDVLGSSNVARYDSNGNYAQLSGGNYLQGDSPGDASANGVNYVEYQIPTGSSMLYIKQFDNNSSVRLGIEQYKD